AFAWRQEHPRSLVLPYIAAQMIGAYLGVLAARAVFDLDLLQWAGKTRSSLGLWLSEVIGTFGLVFVIFGGVRHKPDAVPPLVALYITGAYWFTSSSTFALPGMKFLAVMTDPTVEFLKPACADTCT